VKQIIKGIPFHAFITNQRSQIAWDAGKEHKMMGFLDRHSFGPLDT